MLASIALAGCSNEELIETEDIKKPQAELVRGDAYVNFVINTKTDSSRGTVGDGDGTADNSGHEVAGTEAENTINKLLLVIAKVDDGNTNTQEPTLYTEVKTESVDKVQNGYVGYFNNTEFTTTNGVTTLKAPIRLDYTGKYAVLVVVNPVSDLEAKIGEGSNHKTAYETILEYDGLAYEGTSFQMSNKEVCLIEATAEHNTPNSAVTAPIAVERTTSKATWRWTAADNTLPGDVLKTKNNVYPVTVNVNTKTAELKSFWYKKAETEGGAHDTYYYSQKLNKATSSLDNKTYWVLFYKNNTPNTDAQGKIILSEVEAIFAASDSYTKYIGVIDDTNSDLVDDEDDTQSVIGREIEEDLLNEDYAVASNRTDRVTAEMVASLTFEYSNTVASSETYYVHLTHYALTNLTPSVYAVRHIDNGTKVRTMGILGSSEYLATPYYATINGGGTAAFKQTLSAIEEDAYNNEITAEGSLFKALPTAGDDGTPDSEHYTEEGASNSVGGFMEYLNENSCNASVAKAGTVTGIVLAGDIYDNTGAQVPVMYQYNQKFYRTLQALVEEVGTNGTFVNNGVTITPNSTDEDAEDAGIEVYKNGRCFYYSAQIKHFDNGISDSETNGIGVMEFAIMRNNIYSLGVNSIQAIGDARVSVTEDDPISDIRAYVDLEVSILPWIVRFNDLEL